MPGCCEEDRSGVQVALGSTSMVEPPHPPAPFLTPWPSSTPAMGTLSSLGAPWPLHGSIASGWHLAMARGVGGGGGGDGDVVPTHCFLPASSSGCFCFLAGDDGGEVPLNRLITLGLTPHSPLLGEWGWLALQARHPFPRPERTLPEHISLRRGFVSPHWFAQRAGGRVIFPTASLRISVPLLELRWCSASPRALGSRTRLCLPVCLIKSSKPTGQC